MKFEHVLHIYWSKGFLISGKLQNFQTDFDSMFNLPGGFSWPTKLLLIDRFEFHALRRHPKRPIASLAPFLVMALNIMFSQLTSVNDTVLELTKYNLVRLYLIKTTRGRCHALGKPSRGQRTWSNAWTAYNNNRATRAFINEYQQTRKKEIIIEKLSFKVQKKKSFIKHKKETVTTIRTRINYWF